LHCGIERQHGERILKAYRRVRRYSRVAMVLHWVVAAGIAFLFVHGFAMMHIEPSQRTAELNLHRSVGVVVFALVLLRIWWRIAHPPPHVRMPAVQAWVANYVHLFIYALLVVNGVAGFIGWIASGDPIVFFGVQIAGGCAASPMLNRVCLAIGLGTARTLIVVIALHVLAAVKHQWLDHDRLIARMMPGRTILLPLRTIELVQWARKRRRERRAHRGCCEHCGAPLGRKSRIVTPARAYDLIAAQSPLKPG
jgi:cytochrome b561